MILETIIIIVYTIALLLILMYALAQLNLLFNYLSAKKSTTNSKKYDLSKPSEIPFVTIQLPVYNEMYVMERLLDNIAKIDYPNDKLEIQVLDDSTDETVVSTKKQVDALKAKGVDIKHITRTNRVGFKAGALKEGLEVAKGEIIAIFDSDFLPSPDWLKRTVPYFKDEQIGVVQTKWGHINRDYSILTKIQAFALDAHFSLEQVGRNIKGHFINFNGTAGLWRKACILDAGNWEGDTLTEDLDLSYRAQLKNWKFKYLEDVETPAELPVVISAARSQQFRWNKGGAENFKKMKWRVIKSKNISSKTKMHGYWVMYKKTYGGGIKSFFNYIGMFFVFFSIAMGFSLHNSIAVIQGHLGKKSEFVRTPKFNVSKFKDNLKNNKYIKKTISINVVFEGLLMLYFAFGMYSAFVVGNQGGDFGLFPFHLMLFLGFGYVFFKSLTSKV